MICYSSINNSLLTLCLLVAAIVKGKYTFVEYNCFWLYKSRYYSFVIIFNYKFYSLYSLLTSFGGQYDSYLKFGKIPPNFYYNCEELQYSSNGSIFSPSIKTIFFIVSSCIKFLAIPQRNLQVDEGRIMYATYILHRYVDCRKDIEVFIGPIIDITPSYPTSIIVTQF